MQAKAQAKLKIPPQPQGNPERLDSIVERVVGQLRADLEPFRDNAEDFERVEVTFLVDSYKATQRTRRYSGAIRRITQTLERKEP